MINDPVKLRTSASGQARLRDEPEPPLVVTVDDNAAVRDAVHKLMLSAGMECVCFASTRELLEANVLDRPGRLIDRAAVSRANSKFRQALRQL